MGLFIALLTVSIILLLGAIGLGETNLKLGIGFFILSIGFIILAGRQFDSVKTNEYRIKLPEEYLEISKWSDDPDTLVSYIKGDTVYFEFLTARRNANSCITKPLNQ